MFFLHFVRDGNISRHRNTNAIQIRAGCNDKITAVRSLYLCFCFEIKEIVTQIVTQLK